MRESGDGGEQAGDNAVIEYVRYIGVVKAVATFVGEKVKDFTGQVMHSCQRERETHGNVDRVDVVRKRMKHREEKGLVCEDNSTAVVPLSWFSVSENGAGGFSLKEVFRAVDDVDFFFFFDEVIAEVRVDGVA